MFVPKYSITQQILNDLSQAVAAKELVDYLPLNSNWQMKLKRQADLRLIYFNLRIAGSDLSIEQLEELISGGEVMGVSDQEQQEIQNYLQALQFIELVVTQVGIGRGYYLTLETIAKLHSLLSQGLVLEASLGVFRLKQVVVKEVKTSQVVYTPPPSIEVPYLMEDLVTWVNSEEGRATQSILKMGIVISELERIHPFSVNNSKLARLVGHLLLYLDGWFIARTAILDEYFDSTLLEYHQILQATFNQPVVDTHERDLTVWLEYFTKGIAQEFNQTKEMVKRISQQTHLKDRLGEEIELNERQMMIMEYLHRHKSIKNSDFRKIFPDFSDDTVLREIKFLRKKNLIKKEGGTKNAVYVLARVD